ncbi:MAG: hypothetical protein PHR43_07375 [Dehalococcoidales bacterium]|nr:hypothetical protein [Dehalococcoidales bacterium]
MAKTLKQEALELLADVPPEYVFYCHDCCTVKNMKELAAELAAMDDAIYAFHVTAENNDFHNWVRDIIKDNKLAKDLKEATSQAQAARRVTNRVSLLSKRL